MLMHRQPVTWNALVSKFTLLTVLSPILLYRQFIISKSGSHLDSLSTTQSSQYLESRMDFVIHILTQLRSFTGFNGFGWSIWFTPWHLIDNTIVAMAWVTHGFRCLNHETWVTTWVRHAFSSSILTICQLFAKSYWRNESVCSVLGFGVSSTKLWGINAVCRTVRWSPSSLLLLLLLIIATSPLHAPMWPRISPSFLLFMVLQLQLNFKREWYCYW